MNLSTSDIIQIIGILASLVTSIIAIILSRISIKQNSKMMEETSRPVIQVYPYFSNSIAYIVFKNFGNSSATIDKITCPHYFKKEELFYQDEDTPTGHILKSLEGALFAPNYSFTLMLNHVQTKDTKFKIRIKYHSAIKTYRETFEFTLSNNYPFPDKAYPNKPTSNEEALYDIAKELRDMNNRNI